MDYEVTITVSVTADDEKQAVAFALQDLKEWNGPIEAEVRHCESDEVDEVSISVINCNPPGYLITG